MAIPAILVRPSQHQPQIDPVHWPEISERARFASLRDLAVEYGVSHETIRIIVQRVAAHRRAVASPEAGSVRGDTSRH